ncbi:hypothetical protein [Candidatus Mycoplasma haematominutum]|uniref:Lipoprotein n=1 Tax=Candidatus Mycoplasma haematominutum 'Birmingham 1' TaxID=1116213 RepID=G8C3Q0_9MOLU|nr:hypothetical protein [Candidatus Mycoplasma haematominutum]CCE66948.1 hypothetical protein MHM_04300 [Candidatus Mycoplasma haematominutum 'Birmingham 1']
MELAIRPILYLSSAVGGCCAIATPISLAVGRGVASSVSTAGENTVQLSSEQGQVDRDVEVPQIVKCGTESRSTEVQFGEAGIANVCWRSELEEVQNSKFSELFKAGWTSDRNWSNLELENVKAYCKTESTGSEEDGSAEGLWPISRGNPACAGIEYLEQKNNNSWAFLKRERKRSNNYEVRVCTSDCWSNNERNSKQELQNWATEKSEAFKEVKFYTQSQA